MLTWMMDQTNVDLATLRDKHTAFVMSQAAAAFKLELKYHLYPWPLQWKVPNELVLRFSIIRFIFPPATSEWQGLARS